MELDVDRDLYETLSRRATEHGFESAEAYSEEILEIVVRELESGTERGDTDAVTDDEAVNSRLEDLGYLE